MSEYLLESGKGGSIANVAYSSCGVSSTSQLLYKGFLNNLFKHGEHCLGRAVFAAKCSIIARYPNEDSLYGPAILWTLLGDPALRVRHRITSGIEEGFTPQASSRRLTISPNPCDRSTSVYLATPLPTHSSLSVFDASGRLVHSQPARTSSFVLSTSSFAAGVYVARSVSGMGSASARFVVQHR
jgi:hypothetical protein